MLIKLGDYWATKSGAHRDVNMEKAQGTSLCQRDVDTIHDRKLRKLGPIGRRAPEKRAINTTLRDNDGYERPALFLAAAFGI